MPITRAPLGTTVPGTTGPADVGSSGEAEGLHGASQRVEQAEARSVVGDLGVDLVVVHVIGNVLEDLVGGRAHIVLTLSDTGVATHGASGGGEGGASGKLGKNGLVGELADGAGSDSSGSGKSRGGDRSSGGGSKRCSQGGLRDEARHLRDSRFEETRTSDSRSVIEIRMGALCKTAWTVGRTRLLKACRSRSVVVDTRTRIRLR